MGEFPEPKVGDLMWVEGYFDVSASELGEIKRLFSNDERSPIVVAGICQNSWDDRYTKFFIDLTGLRIFDFEYHNEIRIFYAQPKNKS